MVTNWQLQHLVIHFGVGNVLTSRSESGGGEGLLFLRPRPRDFPSEPRRNRSESESLMGVDGLWIALYSAETHGSMFTLQFQYDGTQINLVLIQRYVKHITVCLNPTLCYICIHQSSKRPLTPRYVLNERMLKNKM